MVVDRRWSWSSVTDSDELVGRISFVSRFPQYLERPWVKRIKQKNARPTYLMQAILTGADVVAW